MKFLLELSSMNLPGVETGAARDTKAIVRMRSKAVFIVIDFQFGIR